MGGEETKWEKRCMYGQMLHRQCRLEAHSHIEIATYISGCKPLLIKWTEGEHPEFALG